MTDLPRGDAVEIPSWAWEREEIRSALRSRDAGAVLRFAQQYGGASQARIASATGLLQGRVNEIVHDRRSVVRIDIFERIAQGLRMPDEARMLMGLAPTRIGARDPRSLLDHPQVAAIARTKPEAVTEIGALAESAAEVDLIAVRGLGMAALADSLLRGPLTREGRPCVARLRVLVLHPDSPVVTTIAEEVGETPRFFAASLRFAEELFAELAEEGTVDLEVYRYDVPPVWRVVRLDGVTFTSVIGRSGDPQGAQAYRLASTPPASLTYGFDRLFEVMRTGAKRLL